MKYFIELSGRDVNLIQVAIRLRIEACEENNDDNSKYWAKRWNELLFRIKAKKQKRD